MHDMRSRVPFGAIAVAFIVLSLFAAAVAPRALFAQTSNADRRAQLQSQLDELEQQIAQNQATVDKLDAQGKSLSNEVAVLNAQIKKAQLQVQATQVAIKQLDQNIAIHQNTITNLSDKLSAEKASLAEILRKTDEIDTLSLPEVAFASDDFSTLLGDLDSFAFLKQSLGDSYTQITGIKLQTEAEKNALEDQLNQQQQIAQLQIAAKQQVQNQQQQKQQLLTVTKGQESAYQKLIAVQQKTASQIRAELFGLAGGGGKIPLPTAIQYAKQASQLTGVRPALILAILSQESDLGANTGQCYVTDISTGNGVGNSYASTGVMKAPRDTVPFQQITSALGRDWSKTPVSCPLDAHSYGGAMGPTQFIPSTWMHLQSQLQSALGVSATDPWNPLHAMVATGIYLAADGAAGGGSAAESKAAAMYYAGSGWATYGQVYATSVMDKAAQFQSDIDTLAGS